MKTLVTWIAVGVATAGLGWAEPEEEGPKVFPNQEDAMLRKLMGEMLKEAEEDRREMEKPVELPQLDAPELRRLVEAAQVGGATTLKRWTIGVVLKADGGDWLVVERVVEGSPAAAAGLKGGDALRDVNGIRVRDHQMLVDLLQLVRDQELVLGVVRNEETLRLKVVPQRQTVARGPGPEGMDAQRMRQGDEILDELRGMRALMDQMLAELKKQNSKPPTRPRVRHVPQPPQN